MTKSMSRRWLLLVLVMFTLSINTSVKAEETEEIVESVECVVGSEIIVTNPILVTGGIASVSFTVIEGCEDMILTLASYQIGLESEFPQNRFARSASTFSGGGSYVLRVDVPECSYHVDFIKGDSVKTLEVGDGQYKGNFIATFNGPACGENQQPVCLLGREAVIIEGDRGDGDSFTIEGNTATASFKIAEGCTNIPVSLLAFQRITEDRLPQTLEDSATGNFSYDEGAIHTLSVEIPPCQMQADLLYGAFVGTELNESNINEFSTRALDWITNLTVCEVTPPTPPTPPAPTSTPPPPPGAPNIIIIGSQNPPPPPVVITPVPEVVITPTPIVLGEQIEIPEGMGGVETTPIGGVAAGMTIPMTVIMGLLLIAAGITGLYISKQGQLDL